MFSNNFLKKKKKNTFKKHYHGTTKSYKRMKLGNDADGNVEYSSC